MDVVSLAVGGAIGLVASLTASFAVVWWHKPRMWKYGFVRRPNFHEPEGDSLLKLCFELRGDAPGISSIELTYFPPAAGKPTSVLGKWDERSTPLVRESVRVTDTYFQPLHSGRTYTVPVIWEANDGSRRELFSGWWYSTDAARAKRVPTVDSDGKLKLQVSGTRLGWERTFDVSEILGAPTVPRADSDSEQAHLRAHFDSIVRYGWRSGSVWESLSAVFR
jgi:hypothetical protein